MKEIVLIPAYKPDEKLVTLVKQLNNAQLNAVVVNDGSGSEYDEIFGQVSEFAVVVSHPHNCGKGRALKTGIKYISENFSECRFFITADADGQHRVEDILRVRSELENGSEFVLTTRKLKRNIPFRSKFGNDLSRFVYTLATGKYFSDNQSGLRGFSVDNAKWLLEVKGEKYDYEMNMLYYAAKQAIPVTTLDIEAVYIDGNKSSHFNPVLDTVRIYRLLFNSAKASIISAIAAQLFVFSCFFIPDTAYDFLYITAAGLIAALITYLLNKFLLFKNVDVRDGLRTLLFTVVRYVIYTIFAALIISIFPVVPVYLAFVICVIIGLPVRFYLHKYVDALN